MDWYQKWLQEEKRWIGKYQNKIITMSILKVVPATLIGLCAIFGGMTYVEEKNAGIGIIGGLAFGIFISAIYLFILLVGLRPGRYVRMVKSAVKQLHLDEQEKVQLAHEMLETDVSTWRCISYELNGHGSRQTPARFRITPHYAFLEGSSPYAILVRLSDIAEVLQEEERKIHTQYGTQTKTHEIFTLYTISFYQKAKVSKDQLPEQAMGFFEKNIRDRVYELISKQLAENNMNAQSNRGEQNMERVFQTVGKQDGFKLENQNGALREFRDVDIEDYLEDMFASPEQFVTLTAPKAMRKVRFVQACLQRDGIEVELGIEENGTRLVYKLCSKEECVRIFLDFFEDEFIPKMEEYQPVQF
ncbi:MAG: hypothetical protein K2K56_06215 [Lachnospiraceae bacterium]|nr:hypothetical protein [Lachnospiraceae bacterium]